MLQRSSSEEWSGGGSEGGRGMPDIIDLDRYMRGCVRPDTSDDENRHRNSHHQKERLVVDVGGISSRAPPHDSTSVISPLPRDVTSSDNSLTEKRRHQPKRFSHDSGLSDGSYKKTNKPRMYNRTTRLETRDREASTRPSAAASSHQSIRAFRAVWERALKDQQAQIAKVAQICERLAATANTSRRQPRTDARVEPGGVAAKSSADSSDLTSSSRSTGDMKRKEKDRTEEFRTYKIIMTKLDELNRLFVTRGRSPGSTLRAPAARSGYGENRGCSTGARPAHHMYPSKSQTRLVVMERGVGGSTSSECGSELKTKRNERDERAHKMAALRIVTPTHVCDIAPRETEPHPRKPSSPGRGVASPNITTESVLKHYDSDKTGGGEPRCGGHHLDHSLQFYEQAKGVRNIEGSTCKEARCRRRARSAENSRPRSELLPPHFLSSRSHSKSRSVHRVPSLCSLCRVYWQSVRSYFSCCPLHKF